MEEGKFYERSSIDALRECAICYNLFDVEDCRPKLLPCGHTACKSCITRLVENNRSIQCPTDRIYHLLPAGGVPKLVDNLTVLALLDISPLSSCQLCHQTRPTTICQHCREQFCADCRQIHLEWETGRLVKALRDTSVRLKEKIESSAVSLTGERLQEVNHWRDAVTERVTKTFDELQTEMTKHRDRILEEVEQRAMKDTASLSKYASGQSTAYEAFMATSLDKLQDETTTKEEITDCVLADIKVRLDAFENDTTESKIPDVHCSATSLNLDTEPVLASVRELGVQRKKSLQRFPSSPGAVAVIKLSKVQSKGQFIRIFGGAGQMRMPTGVSVVPPSGRIVVSDRLKHQVCVFDKHGAFLYLFGGKNTGKGQLNSPMDCAVCSDDRILVSDGTHKVHVFSPKGEYKTSFGAKGYGAGQLNKPCGVHVDPITRHVFVCDTANNRVQVFSSDFTFLESFGSLGTDPGQFNSPNYVTTGPDGEVVVVDAGNHRVQVFGGDDRQWPMCIGRKGEGPGELSEPQGVVMDGAGTIVVADMGGGGRLQAFGSDGTFIQCVAQGLGNPHGVTMTREGCLVVCDGNGCVKMI